MRGATNSVSANAKTSTVAITIPGNTGTVKLMRSGQVCIASVVQVGANTTGAWYGSVPKSLINTYSELRSATDNSIKGGIAVYTDGRIEISTNTANVTLYGSISYITDEGGGA